MLIFVRVKVEKKYIQKAERYISRTLAEAEMLQILEMSKLNTLKMEFKDETGCIFSETQNGPMIRIENHTKFGYLILDIDGPDVFAASGEQEITESSFMGFKELFEELYPTHKDFYKGLLRLLRNVMMERKIFSIAGEISPMID